jgi:hypothetical protein
MDDGGYRQPKETQGHIPGNEDKMLQQTFVCNSNNNYYNIYSVLHFYIFNYFNILYFNCITAHLCYN